MLHCPPKQLHEDLETALWLHLKLSAAGLLDPIERQEQHMLLLLGEEEMVAARVASSAARAPHADALEGSASCELRAASCELARLR